MEESRFLAIRRRQIDSTLKSVKNLRGLEPPQRGWISEIRGIIGMRSFQLGRRIGLSQSAIAHFARSEEDGTITLNSLRKVAEGLNCRLVYAFVPDKSFEEMLRERARLVAEVSIARLEHTMLLEAQRPGVDVQREMVNDFAEKLVKDLARQLWEPIDDIR